MLQMISNSIIQKGNKPTQSRGGVCFTATKNIPGNPKKKN